MKREHIIRMVAGTLVLIGVALGFWVHQAWLLLPAFVGANLLQSSLTKWCLLEDILKKFGIGLGFVALGVFFSGNLGAQENLTLNQALKRVSDAPRIKASAAQVEQSQADYKMASAMFWPAASVMHQYGRTDDPVAVFGGKLRQGIFTQNDFQLNSLNDPSSLGHSVTRFEIAQPILHSLKDIENRSAAHAAWEASKWQHRFNLQQLRLQVATQYYQVVSMSDKQEVVTEGLERLRKLEKRYQLMQAPTSATTTSYLISQSVRLELEAKQSGLAAGKESLLQSLSALLGFPKGSRLNLVDPLPEVGEVSSASAEKTEKTKAQAFRPDLKAAMARRQAAEKALDAVKAQWGPDLNFVAGFNIYTGDYDVGETAYDFGVRLTWPFFRAPRLAQVASAKSASRAATEMEQASRLEMEASRQSTQALLASSRIIFNKMEQASQKADKATRLAERRYEEGTLPLFDFSRSIRQWVAMHTSLVDAKRRVAELTAKQAFERGAL